MTAVRPNPHYGENKIIEAAIEGTKADQVTIFAKATSDSGLNLEEAIITLASDRQLPE